MTKTTLAILTVATATWLAAPTHAMAEPEPAHTVCDSCADFKSAAIATRIEGDVAVIDTVTQAIRSFRVMKNVERELGTVRWFATPTDTAEELADTVNAYFEASALIDGFGEIYIGADLPGIESAWDFVHNHGRSLTALQDYLDSHMGGVMWQVMNQVLLVAPQQLRMKGFTLTVTLLDGSALKLKVASASTNLEPTIVIEHMVDGAGHIIDPARGIEAGGDYDFSTGHGITVQAFLLAAMRAGIPITSTGAGGGTYRTVCTLQGNTLVCVLTQDD